MTRKFGFALKAAAVSAILGAMAAGPAMATTSQGSMTVTASVTASCTVSATTLGFGSYSPGSGTPATSTVSVTCTSGTPATITLDNGQNAGLASGHGTRAMKNGTSYLGYDIYTDNNHTTVWNSSTTTESVTTSGSLTAYGFIPSGQLPAPGSYTDTVTVTATF